MSSENQDTMESPKKGPALSTSTSSCEALDPHDPNLSRLATIMFQKTEDYLYGEFTSTQDAYKKLEEMNHVTMTKYADIHRITGNIATNINKMDKMYQTLAPHISKIDEIEKSVIKLEKMAYIIDAYSKKLELKMQHLSKR